MNQSNTEKKGFTLIELLVVVSIIAILSTIGITVFNSAQANSRDAKRRGDIDSIAKVLEANFGTTKSNYYTNIAKANFNSKFFPQDPKTTITTPYGYCFAYSVGVPPTAIGLGTTIFTAPATCSVPAGAPAGTVAVYIDNAQALIPTAATDIASWKLCATLEVNTTPATVVCKGSGQ